MSLDPYFWRWFAAPAGRRQAKTIITVVCKGTASNIQHLWISRCNAAPQAYIKELLITLNLLLLILKTQGKHYHSERQLNPVDTLWNCLLKMKWYVTMIYDGMRWIRLPFYGIILGQIYPMCLNIKCNLTSISPHLHSKLNLHHKKWHSEYLMKFRHLE